MKTSVQSSLARRVSALAIVAAAFAGAQPALAQTAPVPAPAPAAEGEDIVVTGLRRSLEEAADIKRDAPQVMDVITASDVATLPDNNVAEALQRVTGVQITRVFGEGQSVNIRGLQQVRVEVDGRTLLGFSARVSPPENDNLGRSSGLDAVPSSLFGRIEVLKSPIASNVEGGLGGTVNLVTPNPFDFRRPTALLRVTGTYSEAADRFEPSVTGLITTTFADDTIGILIAGEYQRRTSNLQLFERNNFFNRLNGGTTNLLAPALLQYENVDIDRTRVGLNASVQFRVTPEFIITADALYSRVEADRTNQFIAFNLPTSATAAIITNPVVQDGYIVAGSALGNVRTGSQLRRDPAASYLYGLNGRYDNGSLVIEGDAYYSRGTLRQSIEVITLQTANNAVRGTYDFRAGTLPSLSLTTPGGLPFDLTSTANFPLPRTDRLTYRANELPGDLEEWTGRFDISWRADSGVTVAAGVRYTDLSASSQAFRSRANGNYAELAPFLNTGLPGFLDRIGGDFPRAFLTATPVRDFVLDRVLRGTNAEPAAAGDPLARNAPRDYEFNERTLSAYVMFNAEGELFGMAARANAGARITSTDLTVDTLSQVGNTGPLIPSTDTNSYTRVLPSANLTLNVTDQFLVRFGASQTLQRAGIAELAPSTFVDATNRTSTSGNAQLTPPISSNLDVSFELYTGGSSLISGAVFYKVVDDFIITTTTEQIIPGFVGLGPIRVRQPGNVASATVRGFELGVQQFFDFLPAPFNGLGVIANYTFSDSEDSNGFPLAATSRHSYNLVAIYESGPVSARVAYNWRDEAVFEFTQDRPDVIGARSQLDAQIGFDLTDTFQLTFQGQNLLPRQSATVEYSNFNQTALNSYALSERRYTVGLRARF